MKLRYHQTTDTFEPMPDEVDMVNQLLNQDILKQLLFTKLDRIITLLEGLE